MLQVGDTLVSIDIIERCFLCDLESCKGSCCIEGDAGAPLEQDELKELQRVLPAIWDDLSPEAQELIQKQGVAYIDYDGELVTTIINGEDCAFTYYDEKGICRCAIEKAYHEGKTDFLKPISCHLYPIRVKRYERFQAVNYNRWGICKPAEALGSKRNLPVYQFLKAPLIRKFGEAWYAELEKMVEEWLNYQSL